MPWNGSGSYTRSNGSTGWQNDAAALIGIEPGLHDSQDNDLATGINTCLTKDGQNVPTANLGMGGFSHNNVGNATARTQYPSYGQVQDKTTFWAGSSGGTANALTLSPSPSIPAYVSGQSFKFIATATSTLTATLNVSGLGAVGIFRPDNTAFLGGEIQTGNVYEVIYNGSVFILTNPVYAYNDVLTLINQGVSIVGGSVYTRARREGKQVTYTWKSQINATGTAATAITVTLPISASTGSFFMVSGSAGFYDSSANTTYVLLPAIVSSTTINFFCDTSGGNNFGNVPAVTAASGDFLSGTVIYEIP